MLFCLVLIILAAWHYTTGKIEFERITSRKEESFYWVTILVSNTLGTALGDFVATTTGLGFEKGALVFTGLIVIVAAAYYLTSIPRTVLFWSAYVLTRPLGATLGDTLTKPNADGGLNLSRITSSLVIAAVMIIIVTIVHRRQGAHAA